MVVYRLNNCIMQSFHSSYADPKLQNCTKFASVMSVVIYCLNNVIMQSLHSSHTYPYYQNLGNLCKCNSVRAHPYAYPKHVMVLKHVLYIKIWL